MERTTVAQPLHAIAGNICWKCKSPKLNGPSRPATKPENPSKCDLDNLPVCGACRRVKYCCAECQKGDWPKHKKLCRTFKIMNTMIEAEPSAHPVDFAQPALSEPFWVILQRNRIQLFRATYGDGALQHDRPLLYGPRCFYCLRSPFHGIRLEHCSGCRIVMACAEHRPSLLATHTPEKCKDWDHMAYLELCREDFLKVTGEPAIVMANAKIEPAFHGLTDTDWTGYLTWRQNDYLSMPGEIVRLLTDSCTESASMIVTILAGLQHALGVDGLNALKTLTVHIINSDSLELLSSRIYEEALHILPNLQTVDVVIICEEIGMQASRSTVNRKIPMDCCPRCSRAGKKRSLLLVPELYEEYMEVEADDFKKPDIIVSFNLGLAEQNPYMWRPTIAEIISLDVPVVMTAYNEGEARADVDFLTGLMGGKLLLAAQPNRWRSKVAVPEPEVGSGDLFWKNAWWFMFKGEQG